MTDSQSQTAAVNQSNDAVARFAEDVALVAEFCDEAETGAVNAFATEQRIRFVQRALHRHRIPTQDSEEVAQEAWLDALRQMRAAHYRGEAPLQHWLERILDGKALDYWRKQQRQLVRLEPEVTVRDEVTGEIIQQSVLEVLPAPTIDPVIVQTVREILPQIPAEQRLILLLTRLEGWPAKEIAALLELAPQQVYQKLYAAERTFRRLLETPPVGKALPDNINNLPSVRLALTGGQAAADQSTEEQPIIEKPSQYERFATQFNCMLRATLARCAHRLLFRSPVACRSRSV